VRGHGDGRAQVAQIDGQGLRVAVVDNFSLGFFSSHDRDIALRTDG